MRRFRVSQIFPVLIMLGLAALTFWLEQLVRLPESQAKRAAAHEPDFIVERFLIKRMNAEGLVQSTLAADRMVHFADDDSTELQKPRFLQENPGQPPIEVVGDRGSVTKDGENVRLYDNVVVTRQGVKDRPPMRIDTEFLEIFPNEEVARTDRPVLITEGSARINGVGIEVRAKSREVEVGGRVRGVYLPPKPEAAAAKP